MGAEKDSMRKTVEKFIKKLRMEEAAAEAAVSINPENSSLIRILEGEYIHQQGVEEFVIFPA